MKNKFLLSFIALGMTVGVFAGVCLNNASVDANAAPIVDLDASKWEDSGCYPVAEQPAEYYWTNKAAEGKFVFDEDSELKYTPTFTCNQYITNQFNLDVESYTIEATFNSIARTEDNFAHCFGIVPFRAAWDQWVIMYLKFDTGFGRRTISEVQFYAKNKEVITSGAYFSGDFQTWSPEQFGEWHDSWCVDLGYNTDTEITMKAKVNKLSDGYSFDCWLNNNRIVSWKFTGLLGVTPTQWGFYGDQCGSTSVKNISFTSFNSIGSRTDGDWTLKSDGNGDRWTVSENHTKFALDWAKIPVDEPDHYTGVTAEKPNSLSNLEISASFKGDTAYGVEQKMGLLPYYKDSSNFIDVMLSHRNSDNRFSVVVNAKIGGKALGGQEWHDFEFEFAWSDSTVLKVVINGNIMTIYAGSSNWSIDGTEQGLSSRSLTDSTIGLWGFNTSFTASSFAVDNNYVIKYHSNGGTGSMDETIGTNGSSVTLRANAFINEGFRFAGWATTSEGEVVYADLATITSQPVGTVIDLYAKWIAQVTVTFNTDGGTTIESVVLDIGSKVSKPNDPTKDNHVFKGWFKENTFENEWDFANDVANTNVTIYARFITVLDNEKEIKLAAVEVINSAFDGYKLSEIDAINVVKLYNHVKTLINDATTIALVERAFNSYSKACAIIVARSEAK